MTNQADLFWHYHLQNFKSLGKNLTISEELKNLITFMLQYKPVDRLSLAEVRAHPWFLINEVKTIQQAELEKKTLADGMQLVELFAQMDLVIEVQSHLHSSPIVRRNGNMIKKSKKSAVKQPTNCRPNTRSQKDF